MASLLNSQFSEPAIVLSNVFVDEKEENRSAKTYFLEEEEKQINSFVNQSKNILKKTASLFQSHYQRQSEQLSNQKGQVLKKLLDRDTRQFEAYCFLKRKVDHKKQTINNYSNMVYEKTLMGKIFNAWNHEKNQIIRRRKLEEKAVIYQQNRSKRQVLKSWLDIVMRSNKIKIKNNVLMKTQQELNKVQKQYQKIIEELEKTLKDKLIYLKKEQDEHKLIHDKYQAMYSRKKYEPERTN